MERARRISKAERRESLLLWVGVLTGPAAWSLQLLVNYNLEELACAPANQDPGRLLGLGVETIVAFTNILLAVATLLAGVAALHCRRVNAKAPAGTTGDRAAWMAVAGVMTSILFLIIILAGFAPPFFLSVCEATP
jgi:hypothetical protein